MCVCKRVAVSGEVRVSNPVRPGSPTILYGTSVAMQRIEGGDLGSNPNASVVLSYASREASSPYA